MDHERVRLKIINFPRFLPVDRETRLLLTAQVFRLPNKARRSPIQRFATPCRHLHSLCLAFANPPPLGIDTFHADTPAADPENSFRLPGPVIPAPFYPEPQHEEQGWSMGLCRGGFGSRDRHGSVSCCETRFYLLVCQWRRGTAVPISHPERTKLAASLLPCSKCYTPRLPRTLPVEIADAPLHHINRACNVGVQTAHGDWENRILQG